MLSDKIIVVDDNPKVIDSVKLAFKEYEVSSFQDGDEAIEYFKKPHDVSLVLLDVVMHEVSGFDVLAQIRKMYNDLPVIIMTAFGSMDIAVEALRARADDFIEKPFDVEELRTKVRALLKKKSRTSQGQKNQDDKVERIKRFIERNYKNTSLGEISNEICLSSKYISRMFKKKNATSYRDYKLKIKMDRAKELLKDSRLTVYEISYELGYQNPESFMRIFKRKESITPTQYRKKYDGVKER